MTEPPLELAFTKLRRDSQVSLALVVIGALFLLGSVYYAATRLRPLENEISEKKAQAEQLATEEAAAKRRIAALQQDYATLKANAEKLYAVKVTPENQVYELKAAAQATGQTRGRQPQYQFAIYVNSSARTLESIRSVEYRFDHPSFDQQQLVTDDAGNRFKVGYLGWGCLNRVGVTVALKDGTTHKFDFNMCRSLGPPWGKTDAFPSKGDAYPSKSAPAANRPDALPDMAEAPRLPPPTPGTP